MTTTKTFRGNLPPLFASTASAEVVPGNPVARSRMRIARGRTLYGIGDPLRGLYVVHVGVLKSCAISSDGLQQVVAFPMAGDVLGLDALSTGTHQGEVVALEDAELYLLPVAQCECWSLGSAYAQRLLLRTMAHEIVRGQQHAVMLGTMRAEQRVAIFLLDLSQRYCHLGYSRSHFVLRMSRHDIGSYLGLKLETVSRALSRSQQEGILQARGKTIALLDFPALWRLSGLSPESQSVPPDPIVDNGGCLVSAAMAEAAVAQSHARVAAARRAHRSAHDALVQVA